MPLTGGARIRFTGLVAVCSLGSLLGLIICPAGAQSVTIDYARTVRPLLAANCFACHGPDESAREAGLRLDRSDSATATRNGRTAIVAGRSDASELSRRITSQDPDVQMPPPDSGHELTPSQIAVLKNWIDQGADYAQHWAFIPPNRPRVPNRREGAPAEHPIDAFIRSRLLERNLQPAEPEDPAILIRRVALDLTGLPPAKDLVERFLANPDGDAYEAAVDQLLRSPHYGEHWGRMWLDLARYADTKGYEKDQPRQIWRYRDWVIDAFNSDLPYDRFTIDQLAGDLLDDPRPDQILATAFHRNTMTNDEGGTDNEEFRLAAVKDRVDTTVQVWMGLTMGCAKCHSHKYDPISQKDYYRFLAVFNQTEDADRSDDAPRIKTPTRRQIARQQQLDSTLESLREEYLRETPRLIEARRSWIEEISGTNPWSAVTVESATSEASGELRVLGDQSVLAEGSAAEKDVYELIVRSPLDRVTALRIDALTDPSLPGNGPGRNADDPNFVLSELTVSSLVANERLPMEFQNARADFSQKNWPVAHAIDGKSGTGWAISPRKGQPHTALFDLKRPLSGQKGQRWQVSLSQQYGRQLILGKFRLSVSDHSVDELKPEVMTVADLASLPSEKRTETQSEKLKEEFRKIWPETAAMALRIKALEEQVAELDQEIPTTPVMRELAKQKRRKTYVHVRGNFLDPGDEVNADLLTEFHWQDPVDRVDRLTVARWLVDHRNPLTARVAVNRIWARLFGRGLVETEEDFGIQGSPPSHPDLLDWLAVEFRSGLGWSTKSLCKRIVMSETYRQSSRTNRESLAEDPSNLWLSRSPRFRLPAETIRDQALAVSGLLTRKVGGPSVMPSQPEGIWQTTYSKLKWKTSIDGDQYRRGVYTFWRRTSPYPSMLTFDAGSREVCVLRRVRTNTPLQALVTLNDPVFVECSVALADAVLAEQPGDERDGIVSMFRRVLIRSPETAEVDRLSELVRKIQSDFKLEPDAASALIAQGPSASAEGKGKIGGRPVQKQQRAAWTVLASVLLNLDETVMRH